MLITSTPFRVSFFGGGTDLPSFYRLEPGRVLSTTISAHMYITVHRLSPLYPFKYRLSYSRTELAKSVAEIQHPVFRECLKFLRIKDPMEITSIADIPARTGLGSSSSFTVGLLHALHAFKGEYVSPEQLAEEACHVEIDLLKEPVGRQDQYAAAFGGLRRYTFIDDGTVSACPVICRAETLRKLFDSLLMFYVGGSREARGILKAQNARAAENISHLRSLRDLCGEGELILRKGPTAINGFGELLHEAWRLKKNLCPRISSPAIDGWYARGRKAGALGGKLLGAGGTGFLLFFAPKKTHPRLRRALNDLAEQPVVFEPEGSRLIYVGRDHTSPRPRRRSG